MSYKITIESGKTKRLKTAGKYCDRDIVVTASGGGSENEDNYLMGNTKEYVNDRVTSIGANVFANSINITSAKFDNVVTVGSSAFTAARKMTTVIMPKLETIGGSAFYQCSALTTIDMPNVKSIGGNSFRYCQLSAVVKFPKLTAMSSYAFQGCTSMEYVDINVAPSIGVYAFYGCTKLETIVIRKTDKLVTLGNTTNTLTNTLIESGTGYIYVPDALVDSYKTATNWVTFANQIKPLSELVER